MKRLQSIGWISVLCLLRFVDAASANHPTNTLTAMRAEQTVVLSEMTTDWWTTVQHDICKAEYQITWQERVVLPDLDAAYHAPNRAHNLRTYFTESGIRVVPRIPGGGWEWGLQLTRFGSMASSDLNGFEEPFKFLGDVAPAKLLIAGNRIEYHRGDLIEWYINDERGLEQGFILNAPPAMNAHLVLEFALNGTVTPLINAEGTIIEFLAEDGARVIRYSNLYVNDAVGSPLPAHFTLHPDETAFYIVIDASDAQYPIRVDPLATSPNWTAEGDQDDDEFGWSVGSAGDVNGDGYSDIIIGAPYYDNGEVNEGRVYVYYSDDGELGTTPWTAEGNQDYAYFGWSVGSAGNVNGDSYSDIIIGAYNYDNGEVDEGRAYVYYGTSTGLGTTPWTAEPNQNNAGFGCSVGSAGDVNGDGYDDVIIGARNYSNPETNEGGAFVYLGGKGAGNGLGTSPAWIAESNQTTVYFGWSVGGAGDVNGDGYDDVIVGAWNYNLTGRAFVYHGASDIDGGLSTAHAWTVASDQNGSYFGWSVGGAGDVNGDGYDDVIIGAPYYDNLPDSKEGRVYVYHGGEGEDDELGTLPWTAEGDRAGGNLGWSVGSAGDVNGDGYSDVIIGAYNYSNPEPNEGRVYVYHGGEGEDSKLGTVAWTAESDQATAYFGYSVGSAGDVNGDGYDDIIIGAYMYDNSLQDDNRGRVFVYYGEAYKEGDINGDGLINIFDLQLVINCILGSGSCGRCDLNDDGLYNIFDLQLVINAILGS